MIRGTACIVIVIGLTVLPAVLPSYARSEELPKKVPVSVTADKLDYDRKADVYVAEGHVKIEQEGIRIEADKIVLDNATGETTAEGNVRLVEKTDTLRAERLRININTGAGVIYRGDIFMGKEHYRLKGEKIERSSETVYRVENGVFTTCDEGEWYLQAKEINVDMNRYATGSGVSFNMAGLPVLYTPYLLFPVRRQSGLLIPEIGNSSTEGFLLKTSLFWALSDSKDATFYSDYREKHGHGTGVDYRYVNSKDSQGNAFYNYFDTFHSGGARWLFSFQHREEFADDLTGRVDINLLSDPFYYRDLEQKLELRSLPYQDSNAFYVERWNTASLYLLGQYSTDLTQSNDKTIQKLPELRYNMFEETVAGPVRVNFEGSAVNFESQQGDNVRRADFNPRLTAVFGGNGLSLSPVAGVRATFYDKSADTAEPTERKYYYAGADMEARLSRVYGTDGEAGIGKLRHSIEPGVTYSYIPTVEQGNIPQMDSKDFVVAQNVIAYSLINRLTAHYKDQGGFTTFDLMVFRLSQSYDLNEAKRSDTEAHPRSEIQGELYLRAPKTFSVSAATTYNSYTNRITSSSEGVGVHADRIRFDVTHEYLLDPRTEFLTSGAGFKLGKWDMNAQVWQDLVNHRTTQQEYKAHFVSQCWGLVVSYVAKPGETQYHAMLELKGLGGKDTF